MWVVVRSVRYQLRRGPRCHGLPPQARTQHVSVAPIRKYDTLQPLLPKTLQDASRAASPTACGRGQQLHRRNGEAFSFGGAEDPRVQEDPDCTPILPVALNMEHTTSGFQSSLAVIWYDLNASPRDSGDCSKVRWCLSFNVLTCSHRIVHAKRCDETPSGASCHEAFQQGGVVADVLWFCAVASLGCRSQRTRAHRCRVGHLEEERRIRSRSRKDAPAKGTWCCHSSLRGRRHGGTTRGLFGRHLS